MRPARIRSRATGHFWTLWPDLRDRLRPVRAPEARLWRTHVKDERGLVALSGLWREEPCTVAVIVIHGLGGNPRRPYARRAARAIAAHGWSCLRLGLRGSDLQTADFYHAGLVDDLEAAIASPALRPYERIVVLGYSLGGHLALRYACLRPDPRVRAVTAVCSPLDLQRAARTLDEKVWPPYRRHILRSLRMMYRKIAALGPVPTDPDALDEIDTIRQWDAHTVCPRFGFSSPDEYYRTQSVAPRLRHLHVPALLVVSRNDPMLAIDDIDTSLTEANPLLEVRRVSAGGHVGFPPRVDLGEDAPLGLERQILRWAERRLR